MKQSECEHGTLAFRVVFIEAMWTWGSGESGGWWWSTCIFVQTLSLVMSSLDGKHLSVFYNGNPDPGSLANTESKRETTIWGTETGLGLQCLEVLLSVLTLLKRGWFTQGTCNELFLVSWTCSVSEGKSEGSSSKTGCWKMKKQIGNYQGYESLLRSASVRI